MIIDKATLLIMIFALSVSYLFLMSLPFGIAYFYERIFKKRAFPYLFIISSIFLFISFFIFSYDISSDIGSIFFAAGGILLAAASLRLYFVMTGAD